MVAQCQTVFEKLVRLIWRSMFIFHHKWATFKLTYSGNEEKKKFFWRMGWTSFFHTFKCVRPRLFADMKLWTKIWISILALSQRPTFGTFPIPNIQTLAWQCSKAVSGVLCNASVAAFNPGDCIRYNKIKMHLEKQCNELVSVMMTCPIETGQWSTPTP